MEKAKTYRKTNSKTNMKNKIKSILLATMFCLSVSHAATIVTNSDGTFSLSGGTFTNLDDLFAAYKSTLAASGTKEAGFASTVLSYFTSFNPDLTNSFQSSKGYAYAGVDSLQGWNGITLANSIVIDYKIWGGLAVDAYTRNGGVSGTIISQSVGACFNLPIKDVNVAVFAHGGYDFNAVDTIEKKADKFYGEIGIRAMKALTTHTFAGVSLSTILPGSRQSVGAFAGFNF